VAAAFEPRADVDRVVDRTIAGTREVIGCRTTAPNPGAQVLPRARRAGFR